ncbi:MAG: hypothetical protein ACM3VV_01460, partial [Deltaproteobacteria bacterium]
MYNDSIKITLFSLLFCILTIIIVITIINSNHPDNQFSTLYIQAQPDNNDNNNDKKAEDKEEDTEKKKEKKDKKEEKKNKGEKKIKKQEKSEEEYDDSWTNDNWTRADKDLMTKYNYRNLAIPKIYQTAPNVSTYNFNQTNPNDKVQVDKTDKSNVFTQQNRDGSWRIDYGRPRIDIHTTDAGILPDDPSQLNNMSNGNKIQSWNFSKLKEIGYWYKPSDWKNIEITLIF